MLECAQTHKVFINIVNPISKTIVGGLLIPGETLPSDKEWMDRFADLPVIGRAPVAFRMEWNRSR